MQEGWYKMKKSISPVRRVKIDNFGALGKVDLLIDRSLQIIIGPQASGKSTLAKVIYFCRKIRDYLSDYAMNIWNRQVLDYESNDSFTKYLKRPFMGCFGTTKHLEPFKITYYYDVENDKYVIISLDKDHYVSFQFSRPLSGEINNLLRDAFQIAEINDSSFAAEYSAQRSFLELFKKRAFEIFADDENLLYIPAGRNMLATIPDMILPETVGSRLTMQYIDISQVDLVTQEFIRYIQRMRTSFGNRLEDIKEHYLKTVSGAIQYAHVDLACGLIRDILKADYVYDKDGEKLYYADEKWTKLMFGSSGQQEVLWALNCIFMAILQKEKTFLVFEEPESHVFPDSQERIAELVALLINSTSSEVLITTHSPYMLTSFNLLLYAGCVEEKNDRTEPVVDRHYRLLPDCVGAFLIPGNRQDMVSLIQEGDPLIDAVQIDRVSDRINQRMDKLVYQEYRQKEEQKI